MYNIYFLNNIGDIIIVFFNWYTIILFLLLNLLYTYILKNSIDKKNFILKNYRDLHGKFTYTSLILNFKKINNRVDVYLDKKKVKCMIIF